MLALLLPLQLLSSLLSASVCVLGWLASHTALDVVCSERLRLLQRGEVAPYAALVAQGMGSDDAIVQVGGGGGGRGARWRPMRRWWHRAWAVTTLSCRWVEGGAGTGIF